MRLGYIGAVVLCGLLAACSGTGRLTGAGPSSDLVLVGGDGPAPVAPPPIDVPMPPAPPAPVPAAAPAPAPAFVPTPVVEYRPPAPCGPIVCATEPSCLPCNPCGPRVQWCHPCEPPAPCSPGYVGAVVAAGPGLGAGLVAGIPISTDSFAVWFVEGNLTYQDLSAFAVDEGQSGKYMQALVGVKGSFMPDECWHPVVRASVGWMVATGDPDAVDIADIPAFDDYFGGYFSVGFEWDVNRRFTTGPELGVFAGWGVGNADFALVPQFRWNFIYNF